MTTGNKGWDTGSVGVDTGNPGGAICEGWIEGDVEGTAKGGLTPCTGNNGCCTYPIGADGGTEAAGCCGSQGCGRGGTAQPTGGTGTAALYLRQRTH